MAPSTVVGQRDLLQARQFQNKKRLFRGETVHRTSETLKDDGYDTEGRRYKVLENTHDCYHLVLPNSPSDATALDFDALRDRLVESFGTASSTCVRC